jgi:DNA-binding response OmpR family regulator
MPASIILVVDDEPVITQTLVLILNNFGGEFFAVGTTNLADALKIVAGIHPDLVLLDAIMPGARGLDHAVAIRDQWGCNVLMMSGQGATSAYLQESAVQGNEPFEILAKPIHPNDLVAKIREMLQHVPQASVWKNPISFHIH